jgi:hypothetical protein
VDEPADRFLRGFLIDFHRYELPSLGMGQDHFPNPTFARNASGRRDSLPYQAIFFWVGHLRSHCGWAAVEASERRALIHAATSWARNRTADLIPFVFSGFGNWSLRTRRITV